MQNLKLKVGYSLSLYEDIVSDRFTNEGQDNGRRKAIKNYDHNGKSADNHGFDPVMCKNFEGKALKLLHKILNLCLTNAHRLWQDSEIIFLKKKGKTRMLTQVHTDQFP